MDQGDIIFKLKKGDSAVFSDVVAAWQDKVYNTAVSIVQNEEDAEDITQDVFQKVFKNSAVKRTKFSGLKRNIDFLK